MADDRLLNHNLAVVGYGLALWDALADQIGVARAQVRSWRRYAGGAGLNVACGLAKLGVANGLIAAVGQDQAGKELLQVLQSHRVCTDYIQTLPYPTRIVEVTRTEDGEREFAGFYPSDSQTFADAYVTFIEPQLIPQYLYIEAVMLAFPIARETCNQLVNWAFNQGVKILVDVNWRPVFWADPELAKVFTLELLRKVHGVKLTAAEAHWLWGTDDLDIIHRQCPHLTYIFLTKGAQGCDYQVGDHRGYCPAWPIPAVDTTGAGDAFIAGWLYQLVTDGEQIMGDAQRLRQAVRWASAVAALAITAPGAITHAPTVAAVQAFLNTHLPG
ncbi:MAG: carbohydrate kinase [Gloeomargarita sp. DG_2_bins_126]